MEKSWKFMDQNCGDWLNGGIWKLLNGYFFLFFLCVFVCGSMAWGWLDIVTFRKLSFFATFHWFNLSFKVNMSRSVSLCTNSVNPLSLVPHTQTYKLWALTCLSLRTRALLFCMFLMTFDLRYQSGAHWGLRGVPYCVCLSLAHTNPDKELEQLQEQIANSVKRIIDANLPLPLLSANETRFWTFSATQKRVCWERNKSIRNLNQSDILVSWNIVRGLWFTQQIDPQVRILLTWIYPTLSSCKHHQASVFQNDSVPFSFTGLVLSSNSLMVYRKSEKLHVKTVRVVSFFGAYLH